MITGLICTTMTDMGPYPLLNLSSLSEDTTVKLSVIGMTILSMGAGTVAEKQHYRLHGSIPVPDTPDYEALAMSFTVIPKTTKDARINQHGRESTIWLIFESKNREQVFSIHSQIEKTLRQESKVLKEEDDLIDPGKMQTIFNRMKNLCEELSNGTIPSMEYQPQVLAERGGLEYYTINDVGDPLPLQPNDEIMDNSVLIIANTILKRLLVIKLKENVSQRLMFIAGRSASNLNSNRFKNEFTIRNVLDPLEREMIIEKIGILREISE
ncbi:hypothetical protein [Candidatus Hodarchaeum mangrovi]